MSLSSPTIPPLLALPTEIRLQILHYALMPVHNPVHSRRHYRESNLSKIFDPKLIPVSLASQSLQSRGQWAEWNVNHITHILRINRQIAKEALIVFYGDFEFVFSLTSLGHVFTAPFIERFACTTRSTLSLMRNIVIEDTLSVRQLAGVGSNCVVPCKALDWKSFKDFLPGLRTVRIKYHLHGTIQLESQKNKVVEALVKLLKVWEDVEHVSVVCRDNCLFKRPVAPFWIKWGPVLDEAREKCGFAKYHASFCTPPTETIKLRR